MYITHRHTVLACLFCLLLHSITAGIVVEYFVMVVQTTESSCIAQLSKASQSV